MSPYPPWDAETARSIITAKETVPGALLPILHALQEEFGYIDREAEPLIAALLNLSRAEVHGVVTFYHDFRRKPAGPACPQAVPRRGLSGDGRRRARVPRRGKARTCVRQYNRRRPVSLEPVYCLGLCAASPSAMLDGRVVGRLDESKLDCTACGDRPMSPCASTFQGDAGAVALGADEIAAR